MAQPKLRFQREDGTEFPEWKKGCLIDITKKVNRTANEDSIAPIMMISQGNGFIHQSEKYSRDNAGKSLEKYTLLKYGEMAYNHGASKTKPYGVTYCLQEEKEARVPFVYHSFCIANGVPKYWNYALNTSHMDRQLKKMVSSGARMDGLLNINYDTYMHTEIFMPCLEEQQKIADFLSIVEEVIAQSEAEVQKLEQQKKAAMQKIFSQEVRFRREDGTDFPEWEEKTIGELGTVITGNTPSTKDKDNYGGDFLWVTPTDISGLPIIYETERKLTEKGKAKARLLPKDAVLVTCIASIGKNGILSKEGSCNQQINAIIPFSFTNSYYLLNVINLKKHELEILGGNGGMKIVSKSLFESFVVSIPCLDEQQKIADFLFAYDEAICYAKQELHKWNELKKGLLQQMFV